MCATFTDDDIGKPVERADGKVIGTVGALEDDGVRVDPAPDAIDRLLVRFDRAEPDRPFILEAEDVSLVADTRIYLDDSFSRADATAATAGTAAAADNGETESESAEDNVEGADETTESNRSDGGTTTVPETSSSAGSLRSFDNRFQMVSAGVAVLSGIIALLFAWYGYQEMDLLTVGPELGLVSGAAGFMMFAFLAAAAVVAAAYMEPGLDH
ncbi:hypothetical protein [Natronolimnohabitans innermongolicus]|uniref:PRC-barrel domain-containing protein n=1 Tax=Natronolimnohabitans innermongolicus JCM 12255 TaxID=1227499 RepID=L9WY58_9EURY|nr:hypothetical protein [Natronolimnohabitans innermongolicus]ELY53298.1 hypothetical protein C493_14748 [Natronolimnohabitans innermongolicus JCM 12255]